MKDPELTKNITHRKGDAETPPVDSSDRKKAVPNRMFDLPRGYGDNKIVLMVRDPWTLYAYWEIRKDMEEAVREEIRTKGFTVSKSILRVYDVTGSSPDLNPGVFFDIELKDEADNWYVHTSRPGRKWIMDIGILCTTGEFFRLARSNTVRTPACGMLNMSDEEWLSSGCVAPGKGKRE